MSFRPPLAKLDVKPGDHIYFMGIAGTGMGSAAGLVHAAGFQVTGSDSGIYPPMSDLLNRLKITVHCPYSVDNLGRERPDLVVVANALSRGHAELEALLSSDIPYTSFPELLGQLLLSRRTSVVVAGTHGKTTTTALLAHILEQVGAEPGFMIGGLPRGRKTSFELGAGKVFVIEGDEYDTSFFDKGPKFLHYEPKYLLLNNLEYDHADIYKSVEEIEERFSQVISLVSEPGRVIANIDDSGVQRVCRGFDQSRFAYVAAMGQREAATRVLSAAPKMRAAAQNGTWEVTLKTSYWGCIKLETQLSGDHNAANLAQACALISRLCENGDIQPVTATTLAEAVRSFPGVHRRLDLLASRAGVDIFEDFAHHPTAVKSVISGFRRAHPNRRLVVAFEPRNATSRRSTFLMEFAQALSLADRVLVGKCPVDTRIPEDQRMNTQILCKQIGTSATAFSENEDLLAAVDRELRPGDAVIFMSSGSFSGIQYQLAKTVEKLGSSNANTA